MTERTESKMVDRVSKILNQAERAEEGSPEREAFMARAVQLAEAHSIDLDDARAHHARKERVVEPQVQAQDNRTTAQQLNDQLIQTGLSALEDLLRPRSTGRRPPRTSAQENRADRVETIRPAGGRVASTPAERSQAAQGATARPYGGGVDARSRKAMEAAESAVKAAGASFWEADLLVQNIKTIASSSIGVLDEAQTNARNAHRSERRESYLEDAGEHLRRLHTRTEEIDLLGSKLVAHLDRAVTSVETAERALEKVESLPDVPDLKREFIELRAQVGRMGELVTLARPMANQISQHAEAATAAAYATTNLDLLDTRMRKTGHSVHRIDEGATSLQTVMIHADSAARTSQGLAGSIGHAVTSSPTPEAPSPSARSGPTW